MRCFIAVLLGLVVPLVAGEKPREWTDSQGRKMTGTLVEKNQTHVEILVKSKRYKLPIESLSEDDQEYIKNADVYPDVELDVRTVKVESSGTSSFTDVDARKIEVSVKNVSGRKLTVRCVWIGDGGKAVGFHTMDEHTLTEDSTLEFSTTYDFKGGKLREYRGYAVGVKHNGIWKAVQASMKPYERFIYNNIDGEEPESPEEPERVRVVPK
ncbi:signal peptide protein [Haloferula helveola]|uniref:Signal peptide protein n=1 Tax=Haloferula helveola TaxID=490095 RepID=A0ABN6GXR2_9BACT|nr:signal peptide protein [Haloferula helveola]